MRGTLVFGGLLAKVEATELLHDVDDYVGKFVVRPLDGLEFLEV